MKTTAMGNMTSGRRLRLACAGLWIVWCLPCAPAAALAADGVTNPPSPARIHKVLPHFLDRQGRHALSPSLYERDAYQALLRARTNEVSAVRFDVQWRAPRPVSEDLRLVLELRPAHNAGPAPLRLEQPLGNLSKSHGWTSLVLGGDAWRRAGAIVAWRATLLDGSIEIAELKSFLW